jgi:hypothetical protein
MANRREAWFYQDPPLRTRSLIRSRRFELVPRLASEFSRHWRLNGHFRSTPALERMFAELFPPITVGNPQSRRSTDAYFRFSSEMATKTRAD